MAAASAAPAAPPPDVKGSFRQHPEPVRANGNFFRVELLTPDGIKLLPCYDRSDEVYPPAWRQFTYVLNPGQEFELRYVITAETDPSVRYGGAVFVDQGDGEPDELVSVLGEVVCEASHLFVFGEGSRSFHDRGVFDGGNVCRRFMAAPPAAREAPDGDTDTKAKRQRAAQQLGWIRVRFARVLSLGPAERARAKRAEGPRGANPPGAPRAALLPFAAEAREAHKLSQFACVTAPGGHVADAVEEVRLRLSETPAFEVRIEFKHFATLCRDLTNLKVFRGLPLPLFTERPDVRLRLVEHAVTDLQKAGPLPLGALQRTLPAAFEDNAPVTVSDVVHHLSRCVSPAASYFACCGAFKPGRCVGCNALLCTYGCVHARARRAAASVDARRRPRHRADAAARCAAARAGTASAWRRRKR
jgi:hypothetical protein